MTDIGPQARLNQPPTPTYGQPSLAGDAITGDRARAVFGQVMRLVAVTGGCAAVGAYIGIALADRARDHRWQ
jgi:hypothetical protein